MDITELILDDHHEQRRMFALLEQAGREDTESLSALWGRLKVFLELHAAAEEAVFYPALLDAGLSSGHKKNAEGETTDAIRDHNDIRDTVAEVANHPVGSKDWFDAVATVNETNSDHMAEEEREAMADFRREAALQRRHDLGLAFAVFQARHFTGVAAVDKEPGAYVSQAERDVSSG